MDHRRVGHQSSRRGHLVCVTTTACLREFPPFHAALVRIVAGIACWHILIPEMFDNLLLSSRRKLVLVTLTTQGTLLPTQQRGLLSTVARMAQ